MTARFVQPLIPAEALRRHEQLEPRTAAFAHVRLARRDVAGLYRRTLLPMCDEFEDNWVACRPPLRRAAN